MARTQWLNSYQLNIFIISVFISISAEAALYKWVDETGQTHFSDQPPLSDQISAQTLPTKAIVNKLAPPASISFYKAPKKAKRKRRVSKRQNCNKFIARLDKIQQQLRRGYKEPKGNKLRARRRQLSDQLRQCRKGY